MTADVEVGDLKPQVKVDVVLLAALEGFIFLASRASDDQEFVVKAADTVAVAGILHIIHRDAIEDARACLDDLEALLESGRLTLDVSTTDEEELVGRCLHIGEVVLEVLLDVDGATEHLLLNQVVLVNGLGVTLKHKDRLELSRLSFTWSRLSGRWHITSVLPNDCGASLNLGKGRNRIISVRISTALATLLVSQIVVIEPVTLAFRTVDANNALEKEAHQTVRKLHLNFFVALRAGEILVLLILLGNSTSNRGELYKAVITGTGCALGTLKDVREHQHADGALEVLWLNTEA